VLGSKYVIDALTLYERTDIAWILATQTGYPSWADMVEKYTTLCEFWTLKQSHNHVMMGSIDAWFYKTLAGINLDEKHPAYENIIIKPFLAQDLSFVSASIETIRGTVSSKWELNESQLKLNIRVPFNTSADIYIPVNKDAKVFEGGISVRDVEGINLRGYIRNSQVYSVDSGNYEFIVML
jgi:alpha-L-rhamnosidase